MKHLPKNHRNLLLASILGAAAITTIALFSLVRLRSRQSSDGTDPYSEIVTYPMEDVSSFCVDENGVLYLVRVRSNVVETYAPEGEKLAEYPMEADGVTEIANENCLLSGLCYQDGLLYCYRQSTGSFLCLNPTDGNSNVAWQATSEVYDELIHNFNTSELSVIDFAVSGHTVAFLLIGSDDPQDKLVGRNHYTTSYLYLSERLALVDLNTGSWTLTEYRNLVALAPKGQEGFLVEGYDQELEYYFADLSPDGMMSEKIPTGISTSVIFAWDEESEMFHGGLSYLEVSPCCISGSLSSPETSYRYFSDDFLLYCGCVRWSAGHLYLLSKNGWSGGGKIIRLDPPPFFQESSPLKAYALNLSELPDWHGYPVEVEVLMADELALKLLAGDEDFDFVILNTDMAETWNMKRVMAYYPLNDAAATALDGCFDGIKRAATNRNDVWMLPLNQTMISLIYSKENAKKAGISFADTENIEDWVDVVSALYDQELGEFYSFPYAHIRNHLMLRYVNKHLNSRKISFHTEEFDSILALLTKLTENPAVCESGLLSYPHERYQYVAEYILQQLGDSSENLYIAETAAQTAFYQDIILEWAERPSSYPKYQGREDVDICPIPTLTGNENIFFAYADILVVNPKSRQLQDALQLVAKMADSVISNPENHLSANRSLYPEDRFSEQLYDCLSQAEFYEVPPSDLYEYYYMNYFNGTIDRTELLDTLERVINAYYFE